MKSRLCTLYSIAPITVTAWIRKQNDIDLMNSRVQVETKEEYYIDQTFDSVIRTK